MNSLFFKLSSWLSDSVTKSLLALGFGLGLGFTLPQAIALGHGSGATTAGGSQLLPFEAAVLETLIRSVETSGINLHEYLTWVQGSDASVEWNLSSAHWSKDNQQKCLSSEWCQRTFGHGAGSSLIGRAQQLRLDLALAFNRVGRGGWRVTETGNPSLVTDFRLPFNSEPFAPLTADEIRSADKILMDLWDGDQDLGADLDRAFSTASSEISENANQGIIGLYMAELDSHIAQLRVPPLTPNGLLPTPSAVPNFAIQELEFTRKKFRQSRMLSRPEERINAALKIVDPSWFHFRQNMIHQFQLSRRARIWATIRFVRPLVHLREAQVSKAALAHALEKSWADNQVFREKIRASLKKIQTKGNSRQLEALDLDLSNFAAQTVMEHPEFADLAERWFKQESDRRNTEDNIDTFVTLALFAPVLLFTLPESAIAASLIYLGRAAPLLEISASRLMIPLAVGTGALQNQKDLTRYRNHRQSFFGNWDPTDPFGRNSLISGADIILDQENIVRSSMLLAVNLGLPIARPSLLRQLFRSP